MRRSFLLASFLAALAVAPAQALTCGMRTINEGQSLYEVQQRCGPPNWQDSRVVYVNQGVGGYAGGVSRQIPVNIDVWVYDFGPTRLIQQLTFENGRLMRIESLGYGN